MADALCGPSNALQQFQKHSTVDRTLQQDRLQARHSPSQSFRSFPGPNAGVLDPEYEAFQAGGTAPPALGLDPFQFGGPSHVARPGSASSEGPSGWAADFQRLHLSNTSTPIPQDQFRLQAPLQRSNVGGWHQDFMRQQSQTPPQSSQYQNPISQPQYGGMSMGGFGFGMQGSSSLNGTGASQTETAQAMPQQQHVEDMFDEAAFERAFEAATLEMQDARIDAQQESVDPHQQLSFDDTAQRLQESLDDLDRMGADAITESIEEEVQQPKSDDGDELARTAGELLNSVKDNQSEKFQQSSFLALMRQLRDKEVVVDGNEMHAMENPPMQSAFSSRPHRESKWESDAQMTGGITADDIVAEPGQAAA